MPKPTPLQDGDLQFLGVNQLTPPGMLDPGMVADALNARFRYGKAETRLGHVKLPWTNKVSAGASSVPIPFGRIYGAKTFRDSSENEWAIIAADGKVYRTREGNGSAEVELPPGVTITTPVEFEQTYNGLIMFRGSTDAPLIMKSLDAGFATILQDANVVTGSTSENPSDGTYAIPNADRGTWLGGRMFIPYATTNEKDLVAISDYNNGTRYAGVRAQARINQGSSDALLSIVKFGKSNTAICFKTGSIYALNGISGSLSSMTQDEVTREYGLAGARAAINVGKEGDGGPDTPDEVWFLANKRGILRITYDQDGRLGVASVPVSAPVQGIIDRIDWRNATNARFAVWGSRFYAAIPIDDSRATSRNLVPAGATFSASAYTIPVIPGETYKWVKSGGDLQLVNGSDYYSDATEFTAASNTVRITGATGVAVASELRRVFKDCNNAVLVYDLQTKTWNGVDQSEAIQVQEWLKLRFDGEERLFFLGKDGFINLCEWGYADQTAYENLGASLTAGLTFGILGYVYVNVTPGRTYTYSIAAYTTSMENGSQIISSGNGTFVAQTTFLKFNGSPSQPVGTPVYLVDWTIEESDIVLDVTTRAYRAQNLGKKLGIFANLSFRSWFPSISVYEITEGANESTLRLSGKTKSATAYDRPYNTADWDQTNVSDDHANRFRQDYRVALSADTVSPTGSIQAGIRYLVESNDVVSACDVIYNGTSYTNGQTFVGVAGVADFTPNTGTPLVYGPGSYLFLDGTGIDFGVHQEWTQPVRLHSRGREHQLRIVNAQGRLELVAVQEFARGIDARPTAQT